MSFISVLFTILGGLGLFLLGIKLMEDGLHSLAGEYLKRVLAILTKNRFASLLAGFIMTTAIQSSSATTAMLVGFINAGFASVTNSLGFLLGANIGTTTTAQIMSFKLDQYSLPVIGIGAMMYLFFPYRERIKYAGLTITGLGMLFFGMVVMKDAITPHAAIIGQWFLLCDAHSFWTMILGLLVGIAGASLIHSGAALGILIAFASSGIITDIANAIPIIMGCEIGTCSATMLACLRTNRAAKKAAMAHVLFNTLGALFVLCTFPIWPQLIEKTSDSIVRQIANTHTISSLVKCVLFLPILPLFIKMLNWLIPDKIVTTIDLISKYKSFARSENLNKDSLDTPSLALLQTHKEIAVMIQVITKMITGIQQSMFQGQEDKILKVKHYEDIVDNIKHDVRDYVALLAQQRLTTKQSVEITTILEGASELERVGDHIESMLKYVLLATKEKVMVLDDNNKTRIIHIINRCVELGNLIQEGVNHNDGETINKIFNLIKQIEKDTKAARDYYIGCLRSGSWNLFSDMSFVEFIAIMEKYTRHCRSFTAKYLKQLHEMEHRHQYKFIQKPEVKPEVKPETKPEEKK